MLEFRDPITTRGDFPLRADLRIEPGRRVAVIGASGSGKSTLLSLVGGFLTPDQGRILWDGQDITDLPPGERPASFLFQDQNLFPHLSVAQNVGLGLRADLRLSDEQRGRVTQVLRDVGLPDLAQRRPANLSGGQQGRVALARVLLRARPILLLDEATSALDSEVEAQVQQALSRAMRGKTVLAIAHRLSTIRNADKIVVIEAGRGVEQGSHDQLMARRGAYARLVALQFGEEQ